VIPSQGSSGPTLGGGNLSLQGDEAKFTVLQQLGAAMCRVPLDARAYWDGQKPTPEKADGVVLKAHRHGITPMFLFEYYTRWHGDLGGYEKWFAIGQAFAERFRPNSSWLQSQGIRDWGVTCYSAVNEPEWRDNNPTPIPPGEYARALEGLADGAHSVERPLRVSPGGYQEVPLFQNRDPYVKAVAPLFNQGKLHALDIHRYWDVDYVPMDKGFRFSLQAQFDEVKRQVGITADIHFYTTEMNFKKRKVTEDEAAQGFLTALWDALTVTGNGGQRVSEFVLPWNIFHTTDRDEHYGLCTQLEPWTPTARGKVLQMVCRLTQGMEFVSCDPQGTGVSVLAGGGRKLWIWQNRPAWSSLAGTDIELREIPADAARLEVYGWDGLRQTVLLSNQSSRKVTGLPTGETLMFLATSFGVVSSNSKQAEDRVRALPVATLRPAKKLQMPHAVDCNTPSHWDGDTFYVFNSTGHPYRAFGKGLFGLGDTTAIEYDNQVNGGRWIEATWRADDGTLYGWYHFEPAGLCPGTSLTAPKIGALRSSDHGAHWKDLGMVMEARSDALDCTAKNGYFAGGHGDFSVMLDDPQQHLYFFYGAYAGDVREQGVAVARMAWNDRDQPVGKVLKWCDGSFRALGRGGKLTPTFPAFVAWQREDCNAFWGPSVHWNTYLKRYVMLLNRSKGKGWVQEGIYISYSTNLADPMSWSEPVKILDGGRWYPVVVGLDEQPRGTDKLAGRVARFFMGRDSDHEIVFAWPHD